MSISGSINPPARPQPQFGTKAPAFKPFSGSSRRLNEDAAPADQLELSAPRRNRDEDSSAFPSGVSVINLFGESPFLPHAERAGMASGNPFSGPSRRLNEPAPAREKKEEADKPSGEGANQPDTVGLQAGSELVAHLDDDLTPEQLEALQRHILAQFPPGSIKIEFATKED